MNRFQFSMTDGPKLEIVGNDPKEYLVKFIDDDSGLLIYQTNLKPGHWGMASPKYLVNWRVEVWDGKILASEMRVDYRGRKMFVDFASKALGDNLAWIPYVEEFRKKYDAEIHVRTFWNDLLKAGYPELKFVDQPESGYYAMFKLGAFDGDYSRNKNHWRTIPLQQTPCDILGLPFHEIRPNVPRMDGPRPVPGKYIAISEFSTFNAKHWLRPGGWQEIVDWLRDMGYGVVSVSKEPSGLRDVIKCNGLPIKDTARNIQYADAFVGVSSGLSVLAWGLDVPVVMISGFSLPDKEMKEGCVRVVNQAVCHGCGNDLAYAYDRGNWNMCPRSRNFECSISITPDMVKEAILKALRPKAGPKVLFYIPHCSTGGMPQYLLKSVQELRATGSEVTVVEHSDISPHYIVQKNKIKNLSRFHTLNGSKLGRLKEIISEVNPDIVHLQEFPERWLDDKTAQWLYSLDRGYRIVETSHSSHQIDKKYVPDAFAHASLLHFQQYDLGVPAWLAEYPVELMERPPRERALRKLGLDPARKHILHVGLFAPWKNQAEVFQLARMLPRTQFHFVGNTAPNFKDYWEPLLNDRPENAIIWGERSDAADFYAAMDLFYFPSTMECNPIVLKEALSWQMPIMMRNLPAYCGTYDNRPNVHFISDDLDEVCGRIRRLLGETGMDLTKIYEAIHEIQGGDTDGA